MDVECKSLAQTLIPNVTKPSLNEFGGGWSVDYEENWGAFPRAMPNVWPTGTKKGYSVDEFWRGEKSAQDEPNFENSYGGGVGGAALIELASMTTRSSSILAGAMFEVPVIEVGGVVLSFGAAHYSGGLLTSAL